MDLLLIIVCSSLELLAALCFAVDSSFLIQNRGGLRFQVGFRVQGLGFGFSDFGFRV